jgi:hypothetical protein
MYFDYAQIEFVPTIEYAVIANGVKQSRNSAGDCHGLCPRNDPSGQFCRHDFKSCEVFVFV